MIVKVEKKRAKHGGPGKRRSGEELRAEAQRLISAATGPLADWRVPLDAAPEVRQAAAIALQRIRDVAEERISFRMAPSVLKAAIAIREEICGSVPTVVRGSFDLGAAVLAARARADANDGGAMRLLPEGTARLLHEEATRLPPDGVELPGDIE